MRTLESSYMMRSLKFVSQRKMAQNVRCYVLFNLILLISQYESYDDTNPPKIINKDVMRVFDTEAQGWRSFSLANVKYVKTNLESV